MIPVDARLFLTPEPLPAESPWLSPAALEFAEALLAAFHSGFGRPLIASQASHSRGRAQDLFAASAVVLAHGGGDDPRLIYANAAALGLWRRPWSAMVGMPSRLTAEASERPGRAELLATARRQEAISGYSGIRIDSQGRRFRIESARLWTVRNASGAACAQAACFSRWWWL
ncbi:MEKHLA domain-containing protein [Synechococcus sp. Ace-Pa]|nr:MEKHLA domain-containing protein [Synechococcus sp. Ace-Pa]